MSKEYTFADWWNEWWDKFDSKSIPGLTHEHAAKLAWVASAENSRVPVPPPCHHPLDRIERILVGNSSHIDWCRVCGAHRFVVRGDATEWSKPDNEMIKAPVPELAGKPCLVLYFPDDEHRDYFVTAFKEAMPYLTAKKLG